MNRWLILPALSAAVVVSGTAVAQAGVAPAAHTDRAPAVAAAQVSAADAEGELAVTAATRDAQWALRGGVIAKRRAAARSAIASGPLAGGRTPRGRMPAEPYLPQSACYPTALPGMAAFRSMLLATFPRTEQSLSIYNVERGCNEDGLSEHKEGRALDFEAHVSDPVQDAQARTLLRWLTRDRGYQARRLGVMYIIYDQHVWGQYNQRWRKMSDRGSITANHQDHIHFSMTWNGALQRSAYWSGKARPANYGPCEVYAGHYAPMPLRRLMRVQRSRPCPAPAPFPRWWRYTPIQYWQSDGDVTWLQQYLSEEGYFHVDVTGSFGPITYGAVQAYQRAHGVPLTGVWDAITQRTSAVVVGKRAATTITGWPVGPLTGETAHDVAVTIRTGRAAVPRTVTLMQRAAEGEWQVLSTIATAADGSLAVQLPVLPGAWRYRLSVVETSAQAGAVTAPVRVIGAS